eukprot:6272754-Amphidinium_carterae.1
MDDCAQLFHNTWGAVSNFRITKLDERSTCSLPVSSCASSVSYRVAGRFSGVSLKPCWAMCRVCACRVLLMSSRFSAKLWIACLRDSCIAGDHLPILRKVAAAATASASSSENYAPARRMRQCQPAVFSAV